MRRLDRWLVVFLIFASGSTHSPASPVPAPPEPTSYSAFGDAGYIAISGDGRWLAYVVREALWVTDLEIGKDQQVTLGERQVTSPRWSPDGRRVAYYVVNEGRKEVRVWDRETQRGLAFAAPEVFTLNLPVPPQWSPDGDQLYFIAFPQAAAPPPAHDRAAAPTPERPRSESPRQAPPDGKPRVRVFDSRRSGRAAQAPEGASRGLSDRQADPEVQRLSSAKEVLVADVKSGQFMRLMRGKGLFQLILSPDGKHLAVLGNWRRETDDQDLLDLYLLPVPSRQELKDLAPVRADAQGDGPIDVAGRAIVPVSTRLREYGGLNMSWSSDSTQLAYGTRGTLASEDVFVVDVATREVRNLTEKLEVPPGPKTSRTRWFVYDRRPTPKFFSETCPPLWTRDGKALLCIGQGDLWLVPTRGGAPHNLTQAFPRTIDHLLHAKEGQTPLYSDDGAAVFGATRDPKERRQGFCRIDLATGKVEPLWEEAKRCGDSEGYLREDVAARSGTVAYVVEAATQPPEVWVSDRGFRSPRQATHINPPWDDAGAGSVRLLRWKTLQGEQAEGYLALPPGAKPDHKAPLIVQAAAGAKGTGDLLLSFQGKSDQGKSDARGYAYLVPDIPLGKGDRAEQIVGSVLPALDAAVATGVIDGDRIGVRGFSIGGETVNVLITHTDRFRAAVSGCGISDWTGFFLSRHRVLNQGEEGMAAPWQDPARYLKDSSVYHLDKVTTPLLLLHGTADTSVPIEQSEEMYQGLTLLGKEVVLVEYEGATHALADTPAMRDDRERRIREWFDEHMKPKPGASGQSRGAAVRTRGLVGRRRS